MRATSGSSWAAENDGGGGGACANVEIANKTANIQYAFLVFIHPLLPGPAGKAVRLGLRIQQALIGVVSPDDFQ